MHCTTPSSQIGTSTRHADVALVDLKVAVVVDVVADLGGGRRDRRVVVVAVRAGLAALTEAVAVVVHARARPAAVGRRDAHAAVARLAGLAVDEGALRRARVSFVEGFDAAARPEEALRRDERRGEERRERAATGALLPNTSPEEPPDGAARHPEDRHEDRDEGAEKERLGVIRMLISDLKNMLIDKAEALGSRRALLPLDSGKEATAVHRRVREGQPSRPRGHRARGGFAIIQTYLPAPLSEDEVREIIAAAIEATGAASPSDMGKVMGKVMPQVKGRFDGAAVRPLVQAALA